MPHLLLLGLLTYCAAAILLPTALAFYAAGQTFIVDWKILSVESTSVYASMILDPMGLMFSFTVMFIAANVYLFALGYMADDMFPHRFGQMILLFVISMNFLIYSPNMVSLILGWDGLGLTSFLLVVYYQNSYSVGAGLITALTNRIGDVAIILALAVMLTYNSWHLFSQPTNSIICALAILAAMTKSAQFPFCSWLPMAMAAPTPVSALVHSSTLVTAGVFLLIRYYPVLSQSPFCLPALLITGSVTMLLAGISASVESDFKKIVAFSTLSQLGVMIFSLGLGMPMLAFFHLLTHAMFKALLFLCVGTVIHFHGHMQDLRVMGNLVQRLPVIQVGMVVANLALCGIPFLSGFYSKDRILELGLSYELSWALMIILIAATTLTSAYSLRSMLVTQIMPVLRPSLTNAEVGFMHFSAPVLALSAMAVTWGATLNWLMTPSMTACINKTTSSLPLLMISGGVLYVIMNFSLKVRLSRLFSHSSILCKPRTFLNTIQDALANMWFLSSFSSQPVISPPLSLGSKLLSIIDQGWVEQTVSQATNTSVQSTVHRLHALNNNAPVTILLLTALIFIPILIIFIGS